MTRIELSDGRQSPATPPRYRTRSACMAGSTSRAASSLVGAGSLDTSTVAVEPNFSSCSAKSATRRYVSVLTSGSRAPVRCRHSSSVSVLLANV
jgi:hypothetical protein